MKKHASIEEATRRFILSITITACCMLLLSADPIEVRGEDQPPDRSYWIVAIGGDGRDYAPSFNEVDDGYVVAGMTSSFGFGDGGGNRDGSHDFMVVKLDTEGRLLWTRVIGGPGDERGGYSITPTAEGGFLLTGSTRSFGAGKTDIFIVKLTSGGDLEWSLAVGGPGAEGGMTTLETDDGYIALGDSDSFGAGKKDLLAVRLDRNGNVLWAKTYGGAEDDVESGIAELGDGYVIGGTIWSFGAGEADAGLIAINPRGEVIWAKTIGGDAGEGINWDGVRVTSDGGFAFGDRTGSFGAKGGGALFGIKLGPGCDLEWSTMVDGPGEDVGWTMTETTDGFIAGGKLTLPGSGGDVLLVRFDENGKYVWSRVFGKTGLDEIEEIRPTRGGYVMSGVTRMVDPSGDFLVARVFLDGFAGGNTDPITALDPRVIVPITPVVEDFRPTVTDVSDMIEVESIGPTVTVPDVRITEIYRNP